MHIGHFTFLGLLLTLSSFRAVALEPVKLAAIELPPYIDSQKPDGGFMVELIKRAFEHELIKANFTFVPLKLAPTHLKENKYQGIIPYMRPEESNKEEHKKYLFSDSILNVSGQLYARASEIKGSTPASWKGKSMCRPTGYPMQGLTELAAKYNWEVVRPKNIQTCVRMLQQKKVDLVAMSDNFAHVMIKEVLGSLDGYAAAPGLAYNVDFTIRMERSDPKAQALLTAFNRGLAQLKKHDDYKQILKTNGF